MKIGILEDEALYTKQLRKLLTDHYQQKLHIDCFGSGSSLAERYANGIADYDLLFLDIMMKGMDGVSTAREIRSVDSNVPIVFVTSANATAKEIFEVDAIGYISKPITEALLNSVLTKSERLTAAKTLPTITIKTENGSTHRLCLTDVTHISKSERNTLFYRLNEPPITTLQPINIFSSIIDAQSAFVSIYRSDYVNFLHVIKISRVNRTIELINGSVISMARDRVSLVMDAYTHFLGEI